MFALSLNRFSGSYDDEGGRLSVMPFQTRRACSYAGSAGVINSPRSVARKASADSSWTSTMFPFFLRAWEGEKRSDLLGRTQVKSLQRPRHLA